MTTAAMTRDELKQTVLAVLGTIAPEVDLDEIQPTENIRETYDIDSFDFLNFLIGLDEHLGVEIPEADYGQLESLDDILTYLQAAKG